jgi:hypothetical protein
MLEPTEKPKKEKKYKNQIHLRVGEDITKALEDRAAQEGVTVTALAIRYMKQGLGWEQESLPSIDITEIEKRVSERVLNCIPQIDETTLEDRLYNRISERVSQDWINYAINLEKKLHEDIAKRVSTPKGVASEQPSNSDISSVSPTDTEDLMPTESIEVTSTSQVVEENIPSSLMPLFGSIKKGQITAVPDLVKYLNQVVDPNAKKPWGREQIRLFKKKLLTYLKKPLEKRQGNPPCPVIINGYMLDWIPTKDEPLHSYGRQWWIQLLPQTPEDKNQLIEARRKAWKIHEQQ